MKYYIRCAAGRKHPVLAGPIPCPRASVGRVRSSPSSRGSARGTMTSQRRRTGPSIGSQLNWECDALSVFIQREHNLTQVHILVVILTRLSHILISAIRSPPVRLTEFLTRSTPIAQQVAGWHEQRETRCQQTSSSRPSATQYLVRRGLQSPLQSHIHSTW